MSNIGNTMRSFSEYKPTPEQIKSHQDHENKRRLFCKNLEIEMREKWGEIKSNKTKKKK